MSKTRRIGLVAAAVMMAAAYGRIPATRAGSPAAKPVQSTATAVEVEMVNVDLHMTPHVTLRVHNLRGRFVPTGNGAPNLDDNNSYVVEVDAGEVALDEASLTALMNEHVFVGHAAPVKDLQVTVRDGLVNQKGKLNKAIDIPFKTGHRGGDGGRKGRILRSRSGASACRESWDRDGDMVRMSQATASPWTLHHRPLVPPPKLRSQVATGHRRQRDRADLRSTGLRSLTVGGIEEPHLLARARPAFREADDALTDLELTTRVRDPSISP
jgi:hypothetical protein